MDKHKSLAAAVNGLNTYTEVAARYVADGVVEFAWASETSKATTYFITFARPGAVFTGTAWIKSENPAYVYVGIRDYRFGPVRCGPGVSTGSTLVDIQQQFSKLTESAQRELSVLIINVTNSARRVQTRAPDTATSPAPVAQAIEAARDEFGFKLTLPE